MPHSLLPLSKLFLLLTLAFLSAIPAQAQSPPPGGQQKSRLSLSWAGTPGINRYRLQVSTDQQFTDLVFDRAVEGREQVINDLPFGIYYWRVAPAAAETGSYSAPRTIEIKKNAETDSAAADAATGNAKPPTRSGWSAATGTINHPIALALREQAASDVVGVNSDGMVYALDATNGVALWTARFRPDAKKGETTGNGGAATFQPLPLSAGSGLQNVLVAFDGGVRAIEGATGRQLWRAALPGRAASATVGDLNGDGSPEIAVFQDEPAGLSILEANTGRVLAQAKLDAQLSGSPAAFTSATESGILLLVADGTLEVRNIKAERVRSTKLDVQFTTPPLIIQTTQQTLAMLGTDRGLIAVDVSTLKPLWRVATEGDAPRGQLAAADFDNDNSPEVVMVTRRGRTVVISTANGKIKWYANLPNRAGTIILTDLNNDQVRDVLVAADSKSLIGHDGRSGALILGDEQNVATQTGAGDAGTTYQTCAYVGAHGSAAPLVVCNDPAGGGLRADSLPPGK